MRMPRTRVDSQSGWHSPRLTTHSGSRCHRRPAPPQTFEVRRLQLHVLADPAAARVEVEEPRLSAAGLQRSTAGGTARLEVLLVGQEPPGGRDAADEAGEVLRRRRAALAQQHAEHRRLVLPARSNNTTSATQSVQHTKRPATQSTAQYINNPHKASSNTKYVTMCQQSTTGIQNSITTTRPTQCAPQRRARRHASCIGSQPRKDKAGERLARYGGSSLEGQGKNGEGQGKVGRKNLGSRAVKQFIGLLTNTGICTTARTLFSRPRYTRVRRERTTAAGASALFTQEFTQEHILVTKDVPELCAHLPTPARMLCRHYCTAQLARH